MVLTSKTLMKYIVLKKNKISQKINSQNQMAYILNKLLNKKPDSKKIQQKLKSIGQNFTLNFKRD